MARTIAVGDVHGCLEELRELLLAVDLRHDDHIVFVGDLVDRGPFSVDTVRFVRQLISDRPGRVIVLKGNHEDKLCLWRQREAQRAATGRENKMYPPDPVRKAEWEAFTEDDVQWMRDLPVMTFLPDGWVAVHAGFVPGVPFDDQDPDKVVRLRTLHPETLEILPREEGQGPLDDPPGTVFWSSLWKGPRSVVYGHSVNKGPGYGLPVCLELPRIDRAWSESKDMIACAGIDTGCCFGGRLTAAILGPNGLVEFTQVRARQQYAELGKTR